MSAALATFGDPCSWARKDETSAPTIAFALGQHREGAAVSWQLDQDIQTLGRSDREALARHGLHGITIRGHDSPLQRAKVDPEGRRRGAIDQPQTHAPGTLGAQHQRVIERAVVGEVGVVVDVVQVHCATGRHRHRGAACSRPVYPALRHHARAR